MQAIHLKMAVSVAIISIYRSIDRQMCVCFNIRIKENSRKLHWTESREDVVDLRHDFNCDMPWLILYQ